MHSVHEDRMTFDQFKGLIRQYAPARPSTETDPVYRWRTPFKRGTFFRSIAMGLWSGVRSANPFSGGSIGTILWKTHRSLTEADRLDRYNGEVFGYTYAIAWMAARTRDPHPSGRRPDLPDFATNPSRPIPSEWRQRFVGHTVSSETLRRHFRIGARRARRLVSAADNIHALLFELRQRYARGEAYEWRAIHRIQVGIIRDILRVRHLLKLLGEG